MDESNIVEFGGRYAISDPLTELLRKGTRELLQSAIEAELEVAVIRRRECDQRRKFPYLKHFAIVNPSVASSLTRDHYSGDDARALEVCNH